MAVEYFGTEEGHCTPQSHSYCAIVLDWPSKWGIVLDVMHWSIWSYNNPWTFEKIGSKISKKFGEQFVKKFNFSERKVTRHSFQPCQSVNQLSHHTVLNETRWLTWVQKRHHLYHFMDWLPWSKNHHPGTTNNLA